MKTLFILTLILQTQGPIEGAPAAQSGVVTIYQAAQHDNSKPELVAIQSLRMANGEPALRIEVTAWGSYVPQPCQLSLTVGRKPLTLPCFVQSTTVVVPRMKRGEPNPGKEPYIIEKLTVRSGHLRSVLAAKSVTIEVGLYKVTLTGDQLRQLRQLRQG